MGRSAITGFTCLLCDGKALTEVWGHVDACLYWYTRRLYMNQKLLIWWQAPLTLDWPPSSLELEARYEPSVLGMGLEMCGTLYFYLPEREIFSFASFCGLSRYTVDWGQASCFFISMAWQNAHAPRYRGSSPPRSASLCLDARRRSCPTVIPWLVVQRFPEEAPCP